MFLVLGWIGMGWLNPTFLVWVEPILYLVQRDGSNLVFGLVGTVERDRTNAILTPFATVVRGSHISSSLAMFIISPPSSWHRPPSCHHPAAPTSQPHCRPVTHVPSWPRLTSSVPPQPCHCLPDHIVIPSAPGASPTSVSCPQPPTTSLTTVLGSKVSQVATDIGT
jgi:hypothetical protein